MARVVERKQKVDVNSPSDINLRFRWYITSNGNKDEKMRKNGRKRKTIFIINESRRDSRNGVL